MEQSETRTYQYAIEHDKRWIAFSVWRQDMGKKEYRKLTKEQQEKVDSLVESARESL